MKAQNLTARELLAVGTMAVALGGCMTLTKSPGGDATETHAPGDPLADVAATAPASIPAALLPVLVQSLADAVPESYTIQREGKDYSARNPAHELAFAFDGQAVVVKRDAGDPWSVRMELTGIGRGDDLRPPKRGTVFSDRHRIEYLRGDVTEWYVNTPLGLEQGFTIAKRREGTGPLLLDLRVSGSLHPESPEEDEVAFQVAASQAAPLWYRSLYVTDARGEELPAGLSVHGDRLSIRVVDAGAVYPVTIDPLFVSETKLTASDGAAGDWFGNSVSVSGDRVVVGTYYGEAAYVYEKVGFIWSETAKLTASDGTELDFFGSSVSISGDRVVVGSRGDDDNGVSSGSAYIFEKVGSTWNQAAKLTASDGTELDFFGSSVSISGDRVVVGSRGDDDNGGGSGSAYIFEKLGSTWNQTAKLTASDGAAGNGFGYSVAVSGDQVVVGAVFDDDNGETSGSAYVFEENCSWSQTAKLLASDGAAGDWFGNSVSVSGDRVVVGAPLRDLLPIAPGVVSIDGGEGAAYVFEKDGSTWSETAKLTASDGRTGDLFGQSVSVSGDRVVVGADGVEPNGAAYVHDVVGSAWTQTAKLTPSDGTISDLYPDAFGKSVSLSGDRTIAVGAFRDDDKGSQSGSAYVYDLFEMPSAGGDCLVLPPPVGMVCQP